MIDAAEIERILRNDNAQDSVRGDAWDATMQSASHDHLAQMLQPLPLSPETKAALVRERFNAMPLVHRAIAVLNSIPRDVLDRAENHPHVLSAMVAAHGRRKS